MIQKIAAIDMGTNSFHMVVTEVGEEGLLNVVNREKVMVRLGEGGRDMKKLSDEAMKRGIMALIAFAKIAHAEGATVRAVATSATREANNKSEFLAKVKAASGIDVEVISGVEEARIIYIGVVNGLPIYDKKVLLVDIGGGSTETVVGQSGKTMHVHSDKLGAIRLTQRFFPQRLEASQSDKKKGKIKVSEDQIKECEKHIKTIVARTALGINKYGFDMLVGTSGTITNLVDITKLRVEGSVPDQKNGASVSAEDFFETVDIIKKAAVNGDVNELPGLDSNRIDIILAGALIMCEYVKQSAARSITLSQYALREGIVFDTYNKVNGKDGWKHLKSLRKRSIVSLAEKYNFDKKHTLFMLALVKRMFDGLLKQHGFGDKEWELLEAAVYLHDVGTMIAADSHHKHSFYIISNSNIPGFSYNETLLIALISRYHRKSHPKKKHTGFGDLPEKDKNIVWKLGCILRIAEGLDRRQKQCIRDITVNAGKKKIGIMVHPLDNCSDPEIELWGAQMRKEMMEQAYDMPVSIELDRVETI